jgi:tRNA(fMet)-specific endonuclease VapC
MKRYLMDTGIAGLYIDRKRGVYERARAEVTRGNRVGIGAPVLGELAVYTSVPAQSLPGRRKPEP